MDGHAGNQEAHVSIIPFRLLHLKFAVGTLLLAIGLPASGAEDNDARLARGEILTSSRTIAGSALPEGTAQAVIEAPPAKVWPVIDDCSRYAKTMPRVVKSRLLERGGGHVKCQITVKIPVLGELTSITDAVHVAGPPRWSRTWRLVSGEDYKSNEGSWTLSAFDAAGTRTRAVYKMHAEINAWVPDFVVKRGQREGLTQVMEAIRVAVK